METVRVNVQVHRHEVPGAFLEAGVPPHKIKKKKLRELEKGGGKLTTARNSVGTYLEPILMSEFGKMKTEIGDRPVGAYHDGTTEEGWAFCVILAPNSAPPKRT
jgi:hypothetical protein